MIFGEAARSAAILVACHVVPRRATTCGTRRATTCHETFVPRRATRRAKLCHAVFPPLPGLTQKLTRMRIVKLWSPLPSTSRDYQINWYPVTPRTSTEPNHTIGSLRSSPCSRCRHSRHSSIFLSSLVTGNPKKDEGNVTAGGQGSIGG